MGKICRVRFVCADGTCGLEPPDSLKYINIININIDFIN